MTVGAANLTPLVATAKTALVDATETPLDVAAVREAGELSAAA